MICAAIAMTVILAFAKRQALVTEREQETAHAETQAEEKAEPEKVQDKPEIIIPEKIFGEKDAEILLKIAMAEAEGEPVEGKALVMLVVLNRVQADGFPGTIKKVVFQKGQFTPTSEGGRYWTTEPNEECYEALKMVEQGWDESEGALYFEACGGESWHSRNLKYLFRVGNHRFYS